MDDFSRAKNPKEYDLGDKPKENYIWDKRPYIVVSDIHLGSANSNRDDFLDFLEWLGNLPQNGMQIACDGTDINIRKPGTIVLLGDILEFWDPLEDDRNYLWQDALHPLSCLSSMNCDVIYVIGNHDEDLLDLRKVWPENGSNFRHGGDGKFKIVYRNFPESSEGEYQGKLKPFLKWLRPMAEGQKIGNHTYCFLHGHHFDKLQITYRISRLLNIRFDPIDYFQDLANVNFTKNIKIKLNKTTIFFFLALIAYLFISTRVYPYINSSITENRITNFIIIVFWFLLTSFFIITTLPKVFTFLSTKIWPHIESILSISKKGDTVENVVRDRYVENRGNRIKADTIVFGHTHIPGRYSINSGKTFYNTGCWVNDDKIEKQKQNTFLYIDEEPHLLKWDKADIEQGRIKSIE